MIIECEITVTQPEDANVLWGNPDRAMLSRGKGETRDGSGAFRQKSVLGDQRSLA